MVSKDEMIDLIKGTGWKVIKSLDSEGSGYIAILEKHQDWGYNMRQHLYTVTLRTGLKIYAIEYNLDK